jgi:hypothetical protein
VARVCSDMAPWECIAPFCGLAAPDRLSCNPGRGCR